MSFFLTERGTQYFSERFRGERAPASSVLSPLGLLRQSDQVHQPRTVPSLLPLRRGRGATREDGWLRRDPAWRPGEGVTRFSRPASFRGAGNSLPRFLRTRSRTGKAWCIKRATKHPAFPWRRRNLGHLRPASAGAEARRTLQTTAGAHAMRASAAEPPMCRGNAHNKTRHSDLAGRSHGTRVRSHTFDRPTPNPSFGQGGPSPIPKDRTTPVCSPSPNPPGRTRVPVPSQRTGQGTSSCPIPTQPDPDRSLTYTQRGKERERERELHRANERGCERG